MHSTTKFERTTIGQNCSVMCTQTRVAIEMHCLAGHLASSEVRDKVCSLSCSGGRFNVLAEQERCHCSGEFEQLLLTYLERCGPQNSCLCHCFMCIVLTVDIQLDFL